MDIPVFFPNLKKGSTKDCIIQLLTINDSLTNQKIFHLLKKNYRISRSYQTVRQALLELVVGGVLQKNGKDYNISVHWINTLDKYINLLKKKFIENKEIKIIDENTKEIQLNSLYDLGHFILYSFKNHFFDLNEENDLFVFVQHLWIPFADNRKTNMLQNFFSSNNNTVYVANSSFMDKLLYQFYRQYCKVKFNVKFDNFFDFIIQGDCIAKIYFPKELRIRMNKAYSIKSLNFNLYNELTSFTNEDYSIKIHIARDKEMVREIKTMLKI
jgi:hypothetical protein